MKARQYLDYSTKHEDCTRWKIAPNGHMKPAPIKCADSEGLLMPMSIVWSIVWSIV